MSAVNNNNSSAISSKYAAAFNAVTSKKLPQLQPIINTSNYNAIPIIRNTQLPTENKINLPSINNKKSAEFHSITNDLSNEATQGTDNELVKLADIKKQLSTELLSAQRSQSAAAGSLPAVNKKSNKNPNSAASPYDRLPKQTLLSDYVFHKMLGNGTTGTVHSATPKQSPVSNSSHSDSNSPVSPNQIAIKLFPESSAPLSDGYILAARELRMLLDTMGLPNVLQLKGWGTDLDSRHFFIATELLHPIDVEPFDLARIRCIATGLFRGIAGLHAKGIVHGDIKPANCLVDNYSEGIIADLGSATYLDEKDMEFWPTQTIVYRDPKHFIKAPHSLDIDLWSLGCVLWQMTMGRHMFDIGTQVEEKYWELVSLHLIEAHLGKVPEALIRSGKVRGNYYEYDENQAIRLKPLPEQYKWMIPSRTRSKALEQNCLEEGIHPEVIDYLSRLIDKLVTYGDKVSAEDALKTPFFTNTAAFSIDRTLDKTLTKLELFDKNTPSEPLASIDLPVTLPKRVLCPKSANNRYLFRFYKSGTQIPDMEIIKTVPDKITKISSNLFAKKANQAA